MKGGEHMETTINREQALDAFVEREVYACQTSLVEEALRKQVFTVDEIENMYRPFDAKLIDPAICNECKEKALFLDSETGTCEKCFEENQNPQEILEWWLISPRFGIKLVIAGEPVINNDYGIWWGRTTSGQAISMDYVIQKIYDDLMS